MSSYALSKLRRCIAASAVILIPACSSSGDPIAGEQRATNETHADSPGAFATVVSSLSPDAPLGELIDEFAGCEPGVHIDFAPPIEYLASASEWIEVAEIIKRPEPSAKILVVDESTIRDATGKERLVKVHRSYWAAIDWALANGVPTWFTFQDLSGDWGVGVDVEYAKNKVSSVVLVLPGDRVLYPGYCADRMLRQSVELAFGDDYDRVVVESIGLTGAKLRDAYGLNFKELPDEASISVLNPETYPRSLLAELRFAAVHFQITESLGTGYTICSKSAEEWNDCVMTNERTVSGTLVDSFLGDEASLEIWLLDSGANLLEPITLLGVVEVPEEFGDREVALWIRVDTTRIDLENIDANMGLAHLIEVVPIEELSDSGWPGLKVEN